MDENGVPGASAGSGFFINEQKLGIHAVALVSKGISKSGNTPVLLGEVSAQDISAYFVRSKLDHSLSVTQDGRAFIDDLVASKKVDYLLVPWLHDSDACMVRAEVGAYKGEHVIDSNVQIHVLDALELKHIQSRNVGSFNSTRPVYYPLDKSEPSDIDKAILIDESFLELEDDVFRLLDGDCCYSKRNDIPQT